MAKGSKKQPSARRLAIIATEGYVWTTYDTWRSWEDIRTPSLFHESDIIDAKREAERAKAYALEYETIDPKNVRVATIELIAIVD